MMNSLKLPAGPFDAYIFDCDGTLADSMPAHYRAWCEVLKRHDAPFSLSWLDYCDLGGVPTSEVVQRLNQTYGTSFDPVAMAAEKETLYVSYIPSICPIQEVVALAKQFALTHPVAVASGGDREIVRKTLEAIGVLELFPVVIAREDVKEGKPAPDPFLLAAQQMGIEPERCLVFEDAPLGLEAAARAGMQAVYIPPAKAVTTANS